MNKKIAFISNILSPHIIPLCNYFYELNNEFVFIQKSENAKTIDLKGETINSKDYPYLLFYDDNPKKCDSILLNYDVVITGVGLDLLKVRLKKLKTTFIYLERFFKNRITIKNIIGTYIHHNRYQKYNPYLLCAGGYCSGDASLFGNYIGKSFKWGYFPHFIDYNIDKLLINKENQVLWVGRMIDWKHPDDFVCSMKAFIDKNPKYKAVLCGSGPLLDKLKAEIIDSKYAEKIIFLGAMTNVAIRKEMEKSRFFVCTSDYKEGWGVVINEAMNAGCCVIASHACGATPFLIKNNKNGLIYKSGNIMQINEIIQFLLDNNELCKQIQKNAYLTIKDTWNAKTAGQRFIKLINQLETNNHHYFADGPCSISLPIKEKNMYEELLK